MFCKSISFRLYILLAIGVIMATASSHATKTYPAFRVEVKGTGQPLLLIPGLSCSGKVWDETVAHYSSRYECHIFTLAGYAGVPAQPEPLLQAASRDIRQYVHDRKLRQPVVMGHSIGGYLSLKMAAEEPQLFSKVVVVDALPFLAGAGDPAATEEKMRSMPWEDNVKRTVALPQEEFARYQRMSVKSMISDSVRVEQVLQWGLQSDRAVMIRSAAEMMQNDLRDELAAIKAPTLVLGSYYLPQEQRAAHPQYPQAGLDVYRQQYAQLKNARVEMTNTARHFLMYDDPAWFFQQTDAFLK